MVDAWGNWDLFQPSLLNIREIADKHQVSMANVAARYVLEQPAVGGLIMGARLGILNIVTRMLVCLNLSWINRIINS